MLSLNLIDRTLEQREYDRLLRELARNGLIMPLPLRIRLGQGPVAAVALGLRRVVELTYGPTPLARRLVAELLERQRPDGTFADDSDQPCPLATAAAVAALARLLQDQPAAADQYPLQPALSAAYTALATLQQSDALFACPADRTDDDRLLTSAFVLYLLAADTGFRGLSRFAELASRFEQAEDQLDAAVGDLWAMAHAAAAIEPHPARPCPTMPALAA